MDRCSVCSIVDAVPVSAQLCLHGDDAAELHSKSDDLLVDLRCYGHQLWVVTKIIRLLMQAAENEIPLKGVWAP